MFRDSYALRRQDRRFNRTSPGGQVGEDLRKVFKRSGFLYELSGGNLPGRDEVQGGANRLRRVMESAFRVLLADSCWLWVTGYPPVSG